MSIRLTFELSLLSDYHVSAGKRVGPTVDSALLRDYDHAPVLRGTALAGLLRDGLEDLLELPPSAKLKTWVSDPNNDDTVMVRLFGAPSHRKRWAFSSARPVDSRLSKNLRWGSQDAMRVRVNPRIRRADPQKLFNQEEGDSRLKFYFTAVCPDNTACDQADAALLVAAARLVRHMGSARRRGRGECRLRLVKSEGFLDGKDGDLTTLALAEFKKHWLEAVQPPRLPTTTQNSQPTLILSGPRRRFRMIALALEPIIIARRSEAANAYETLPFIPGSAVVGALANKAAHKLHLGRDEQSPDFVTLFLRGGVRVSGLTLGHVNNTRTELYPTVPASPALFACEAYPPYDKDATERHPVHDALRHSLPKRCSDSGCNAKMQPLSEYLTVQEHPQSVSPAKREEIHIRMKRETGRVQTGVLYEYMALEAGQYFVGELDCANEACWGMLQSLTDLTVNQTYHLRLGKASQRGYGLVHLVLQPLQEADCAPWTPVSINQRIRNASAPLRLFLLTDAIITDTWGRFYASFDAAWIADILGVSPEEVTVEELATSRMIDTFHTHRRMPRWRDQAIVAGATADVLITPAGLEKIVAQWQTAGGQEEPDIDAPLTALRWLLAQIEAEGVGVRRHEGFGRIAFNHPIFSNPDPVYDLDLAAMIELSDMPLGFQPIAGSHILETEANFRQDWSRQLDKSQFEDDKKDWKRIDDSFEPVARLIFLNRDKSLETLVQQLTTLQGSAGKPEYLWGKEIKNRAKEAKLDSRGMALIIRWVQKLTSIPNEHHAIGLELLAERTAIAAANTRRRR